MSWELKLPTESAKKGYNAVTGCFLKGHVPFNKGKKWDEWMSKSGQQKVAQCWKNLEKCRHRPRPDNAARCRKKVIAIADNGRWCVFDYMGEAAERIKGNRENIRRCCQCNERRNKDKRNGKVNTDHKYKGLRWYYETDNIWTTKIAP